MGLLLVLNKHRATPYCSACCIEQLGVSLWEPGPPPSHPHPGLAAHSGPPMTSSHEHRRELVRLRSQLRGAALCFLLGWLDARWDRNSESRSSEGASDLDVPGSSLYRGTQTRDKVQLQTCSYKSCSLGGSCDIIQALRKAGIKSRRRGELCQKTLPRFPTGFPRSWKSHRVCKHQMEKSRYVVKSLKVLKVQKFHLVRNERAEFVCCSTPTWAMWYQRLADWFHQCLPAYLPADTSFMCVVSIVGRRLLA